MATSRFCIILILLLAGLVFCGFGQANADKQATARKEDVPFIKCSVCEAIAKQLVRQVKDKREKAAPKKITELQIIDVAENICNMKKEESDWILKLDIVEKGDKLQLVEQPKEGVCKTECKTIERACQEVMGDHDTDVAEYLYRAGATRAGLIKLLCKDLSKSCVGKTPPLPKDREPGEAFTPKEGKQAEVDKLKRSLADMPGGPGMKVYSREDLMNNPGLAYSGGKDPGDPDEGEDEDEDEDWEEDEEDMQDVETKSQERPKGGPKPGVKTWRDSVAKLGAQVGEHTQRLLKSASKSVDRGFQGLSSWIHAKKPTSPPSSQSKARHNSKSDASSAEL